MSATVTECARAARPANTPPSPVTHVSDERAMSLKWHMWHKTNSHSTHMADNVGHSGNRQISHVTHLTDQPVMPLTCGTWPTHITHTWHTTDNGRYSRNRFMQLHLRLQIDQVQITWTGRAPGSSCLMLRDEWRVCKEESRCIKEARHLPLLCLHRVMALTSHAARL